MGPHDINLLLEWDVLFPQKKKKKREWDVLIYFIRMGCSDCFYVKK